MRPAGRGIPRLREFVRAYTNAGFKLKRYPVVERAGVLYLEH
jgi:hypothetical protein